MAKISPGFIDYLKQKIVGLYGKTETIKIPIEPIIEWDEYEVPYSDYETYTTEEDDGIQTWVYFLTVGLALFAAFFLIKSNYVTSLFMILFGAGFLLLGRKYFRKTKLETHKKEIKRFRTERNKREIPQFREEIVPGEWAVIKFGTGTLSFGVAGINQKKILAGRGFSKHIGNYSFPTIPDEKNFIREFRKMEISLGKIPFILNGEKSRFTAKDDENESFNVSLCGIEKDVMDHFTETKQWFSKSNSKSIAANLFEEKNLKQYLIRTNDPFQPFEDELLAEILEGEELESTCAAWLERWPKWIKLMEDSRFDSVNRQVIPEFIQFSHHSQYSSFNFYCPECNKEVANELLNRDYSVHNNQDLSPQRFSKNTRCHYLLELNAWECPMCEKIALAPIPLHKSLDEILLPVYDNLMEENKVMREQDYSDVRRKEIEFKNEMKKETERMYFDNLNGILALKDEMEKMQAELEGETEAINFINDSFARYKNLQSKIIDSIEESNKRIKADIQELAQKVLQDVDRVKDREMELLQRELTELSKAKRIDDERRDSVQRDILAVNVEQNKILNTKFNELIDTNREGFANVTNSVKSLEETSRQGFENVTSGIDKLENTTRKGFEQTAKSNEGIRKVLMQGNAMKAASNEKMGISPYDDSSILRPGRMINRGLNKFTGTLTGKSSTEIHMNDLETLIN